MPDYIEPLIYTSKAERQECKQLPVSDVRRELVEDLEYAEERAQQWRRRCLQVEAVLKDFVEENKDENSRP